MRRRFSGGSRRTPTAPGHGRPPRLLLRGGRSLAAARGQALLLGGRRHSQLDILHRLPQPGPVLLKLAV